MKKSTIEQKTRIFKALANPTRLEIIELLLDGEKCVCQIIEELKKYEQPHISKSLARLKSVGLIKSRQSGNNIYYSLCCGCMREFLSCLDTVD